MLLTLCCAHCDNKNNDFVQDQFSYPHSNMHVVRSVIQKLTVYRFAQVILWLILEKFQLFQYYLWAFISSQLLPFCCTVYHCCTAIHYNNEIFSPGLHFMFTGASVQKIVLHSCKSQSFLFFFFRLQVLSRPNQPATSYLN